MLEKDTILRLRNAQAETQAIWDSLMTAIKNEERGDIVATSIDVYSLTMATVKLNQALRIIELLRYRHDADYKREK